MLEAPVIGSIARGSAATHRVSWRAAVRYTDPVFQRTKSGVCRSLVTALVLGACSAVSASGCGGARVSPRVGVGVGVSVDAGVGVGVGVSAGVDAGVRVSPDAGVAQKDAGWIEDDYPKALALAKQRKVPLFVDASAVWCHTCKAMRTYVLDDVSLPRASFVWLTFDVEKEENAAVTAKFPAKVLPTFFIVDPIDESVHGRWEGASTAAQMRAVLRDGERSVALAHSGGLPPNDPLGMLLAGHRAALANDPARAIAELDRALHAAPPGWEHGPEALLAMIEAKRKTGGCLDFAVEVLAGDRLGKTSVLADFASAALDCLEKEPKHTRAADVRALAQKKVAELASDARTPLSPDDRSDAWKVVWDAREASGDHAGALEAARARLAVIEAVVARTPDPQVTTTYDGARMETLVFLGRRADAAAFLRAQETALPDDYNPAHRLARVLFDMGQPKDALAAIDRAIAKGWGARKGLMYSLKADILLALDRKADARATVQEQLKLYRSLPEGQKKPSFEKSTQERLDKMK
jgi:tetratricopeptide (TPR) repeat protein